MTGTGSSTFVAKASARSTRTEKDRHSSEDIQDKVVLREKQVCSELLDRLAKFCGLEGSDTEDTTKVTVMMNYPNHAPVRNLALTWHDSAIKVADRNHNIVTQIFKTWGFLTVDVFPTVPNTQIIVVTARKNQPSFFQTHSGISKKLLDNS